MGKGKEAANKEKGRERKRTALRTTSVPKREKARKQQLVVVSVPLSATAARKRHEIVYHNMRSPTNTGNNGPFPLI